MNSGKSGEKVEAAEVTTEKVTEAPSQPTETSLPPTEALLSSSQATETSLSSESSSVVDSSVAETVSVVETVSVSDSPTLTSEDSSSPSTEAPVVVAAGLIPVVQSAKVPSDNSDTTQGTEAITEVNNASTTGKNAASLTNASLSLAILIITFQFLLNK